MTLNRVVIAMQQKLKQHSKNAFGKEPVGNFSYIIVLWVLKVL